MKKLCLLLVLITIVGILPSVLQNGFFVLGANMADQDVPFILETKRMLMSGYPLWSWNHTIGDNFIGGYTFYTLTSPFVWLNCLFPNQWMLFGVTLMLILKMLCTGIASWAYLRKMSISTQAATAGALMYAFSSFSLSNLFYYHFLEPMIAFPIFLIAIERFMRGERYGNLGLALASFLVFFINYYFATCSMIAGLVYVLCRLTSKDIKVGLVRMGLGVLMVGVGFMLSACVLLPTVAHLQGNPRQSFDLKSLFGGLVCCCERLRTLVEPKLVEGENPAFVTFVFSSNAAHVPVVGVLLAGLYALRRRNWLALLVVVSLALYITPLNGIFSLFTNPSYTRWAYALTLFLILASVKFMDEQMKLTMRNFWIYALLSCLAIGLAYAIGWFVQHGDEGWTEKMKSALTLNLIIQAVFVVQMVVLFFFVKRNTAKALLWSVVAMSLVYFPVRVFLNTDAFNKTGYRSEWTGSVKQYLTDNRLPYHEGDFEWRTDFMNFYYDISMIKNRPSISSFSSIQNSNILKLLNAIGLRSGTNTVKVTKSVAAYDALMSVKEIVEYDNYLKLSDSLKMKSTNPQLVGEPSRESILTNQRRGDGYTLYDNKYYIPMGFTYDSYIKLSLVDSLMKADEQADVPLLMLAHLVVPDSLATTAGTVMKEGALDKGLAIDSLVTERRKNVCSRFAGDTHGFKATVNMAKKNLLFFSVISDEGFKGYVDGVETKIYPANLGLSAIMVDQGKHHIEFKYFPRGLREGLLLSLAGLIITAIIFILESKRRRR